MAKIHFGFVQRVIDINEEANAAQERYIEMCQSRLKSVPRNWEMLTGNAETQSFRDGSGQVRCFSVQTGREIECP